MFRVYETKRTGMKRRDVAHEWEYATHPCSGYHDRETCDRLGEFYRKLTGNTYETREER